VTDSRETLIASGGTVTDTRGTVTDTRGTVTDSGGTLMRFDLGFHGKRGGVTAAGASRGGPLAALAGGHNDSVASAESRIDTCGAAVETTGQD
jgi:hypothetical protein